MKPLLSHIAALALVALLGPVLSGCQKRSDIDPMFEKRSVAQIYGNGKTVDFTVKLPLSQDLIGNYDAAVILGDEGLEHPPGIFRRLWNTLKYEILANFAIKLGISDKHVVSFGTEFPEAATKYIQSVKVKKIFFALENCPPNDDDCVNRTATRPITFAFLDKLFINLSLVESEDEFNELRDLLTAEDESWYNEAEFRAISDGHFSFRDRADANGDIPDEVFQDYNLAIFNNDKVYRSDPEEAKALRNIFIVRMERDLSKEEKIEILQTFKDERFKQVIEDLSMIGHNIYVELHKRADPDDFFKLLNENEKNMLSLGVQSYEECDIAKCANLKVNKHNLVEMLRRSSKIRFDTYLAIRRLEMNDFRYNGFIELEFKVDPGF